MKKVLLGFMMYMLMLFPCSDILAGSRLTEQQALDILAEQIKTDRFYGARATLPCLLFITEEQTKNYFDFAVHEKHGGKCPGDPNTSPVLDRFRIDRFSGEIQRYDVLMAEFVPYSTRLETGN